MLYEWSQSKYWNYPTDCKFYLSKKLNYDSVWNILLTGQIGSYSSDVKYPKENLNKAISEIDYIRVFIKKEDKTKYGL